MLNVCAESASRSRLSQWNFKSRGMWAYNRGSVLRRWWFWLIYLGVGVIFSSIGEIKAMQWSWIKSATGRKCGRNTFRKRENNEGERWESEDMWKMLWRAGLSDELSSRVRRIESNSRWLIRLWTRQQRWERTKRKTMTTKILMKTFPLRDIFMSRAFDKTVRKMLGCSCSTTTTKRNVKNKRLLQKWSPDAEMGESMAFGFIFSVVKAPGR